MDFIYDILDELSGNSSAAPQSTADENGRENPSSESREENATRERGAESSTEYPFFTLSEDNHDASGAGSRRWERHKKDVQGEYSNDDNPAQNKKISKTLENLAPKEGWLNLDDLDLKTEPSGFPPPSRAPPARGDGAGTSTSGHEHAEGVTTTTPAKMKEQFFEQVTVRRRISYELVEEDVYGNEEGTQPPDLIDISTVHFDAEKETIGAETSRNAEKQIRKVYKAIEEDLTALFGEAREAREAREGRDPATSTAAGSSSPINRCNNDSGGTASKGVAEMKKRDQERQHEMDEMEKAADQLEDEIKKWSAGKEGNLRALLSSLQTVLGPESGWKPVSLQDLLNSTSVRKQYKKATLLVHPDKLQQKKASPQQKYVAEKVFSLLKDASKRFNTDEPF